jgi:peptidoglycan/xylan/chitin deacetylase (PgdA/CDA1 family)
LGFRSFADDVYRCQSTIREITGIDARLVRPPLGRPTVGGAWASIRLGARLVHWSVEGGEWGFAKSQPSGEIGRRLAREIKGRDIILLHDDNEKTLSVLEIVLPALREGGLDLGSGVQGLIAR